MKIFKNFSAILALSVIANFGINNELLAAPATTLVGLSTDGTVSEIDLASGALTTITQEQTTSFTLGGIARKKDTLYYVAAPSGTSENSIYTVDIKLKSISRVDIDRAAVDDDVRALFLNGKKLFAVFYNGNTGTAGIYRIDPKTGATTLAYDFSDLGAEPIGGAFARIGNFYYFILKMETDNSIRILLKVKTNGKNASIVQIVDAAGTPVQCDRIKFNPSRLGFVCMATPATDQVNVCSLKLNGKAKCGASLPDVQRVGGGHTMMSPNGKDFYALVYSPTDANSQRLIKFKANGKIKSTVTISSILVGARFGQDDDNIPTPTPK